MAEQLTLEDAGLGAEDLTLLGHLYITGNKLRYVEQPPYDLILPAKFSIRGNLIMALLLAVPCGVWWYFAIHYFNNMGAVGVIVGVLATTLCVAGPSAMDYWQIRHLTSLSPLVEFDRQTQQLSILANKHSFQRQQVHSLLLLTASNSSEWHSEFQLVANQQEGQKRYLIATDFNSAPDVFKSAAIEFAKQAQVTLLQIGTATMFKNPEPEKVYQLVEGANNSDDH